MDGICSFWSNVEVNEVHAAIKYSFHWFTIVSGKTFLSLKSTSFATRRIISCTCTSLIQTIDRHNAIAIGQVLKTNASNLGKALCHSAASTPYSDSASLISRPLLYLEFSRLNLVFSTALNVALCGLIKVVVLHSFNKSISLVPRSAAKWDDDLECPFDNFSVFSIIASSNLKIILNIWMPNLRIFASCEQRKNKPFPSTSSITVTVFFHSSFSVSLLSSCSASIGNKRIPSKPVSFLFSSLLDDWNSSNQHSKSST